MKNSKLWSGRFTKDLDSLTEDFNESISFDQRLARVDIQASIVHAQMLAKEGILSKSEYEKIEKGLKDILLNLEKGEIAWRTDLEDIHMNIEALLTQKIGSAGKRLHTARSRNDQVATDMMLYVREAVNEIIEELKNLIKTFVSISKENLETYMPGYTHLQRAQPITFAHYILAYCEMFRRDCDRFEYILEHGVESSPLGAGALATTTYPIDRKYTAKALGFKHTKANSLDAVSDRDYAIDFLEACAVTMMHLSRICEEIILYSTAEFNFFDLDDAYSTGSSIMPQKKNPDIAELIRGKTGRVYGNLISLLTTMKGLPLAYNKDMQEDKEPVFDSHETVVRSLQIMERMFATLKINVGQMRAACNTGFLNATDMADWLVKHGMPFREAHAVIGSLVLKCETEGRNLEDLTIEELKETSELFDDSVYKAITIENMVANREVIGSPSPDKVILEIKELEDFLKA